MQPGPTDAAIEVQVDLTNPGQFFACCGVFELAHRLWPGVEGVFRSHRAFALQTGACRQGPEPNLGGLIAAARTARLEPVDPSDEYGSALQFGAPFDLRLDWWQDSRTGGDRLKVWAGSMRSLRIAGAMQAALPDPPTPDLFDDGRVVFDPVEKEKKVEPFYFDARRGANALAVDIGFMPDSLGMKNTAFPAVEFFCLVGLQRFRPATTRERRVFEYHAWTTPHDVLAASLAVGGLAVCSADSPAFRFENAFRTDQRKHKAFTPATSFVRR